MRRYSTGADTCPCHSHCHSPAENARREAAASRSSREDDTRPSGAEQSKSLGKNLGKGGKSSGKDGKGKNFDKGNAKDKVKGPRW